MAEMRMPKQGLEGSCRLGTETFRIAAIGSADRTQVERLFARVFGQEPEPGWHAWKYDALGGRAVGLWNAAGELVAHYAGFPRTLMWQGKPIPTLQIGDVMVAQELRGLLTRRGPFFQVCTSFFGSWVGTGRPFELAFGFPNERAIRLGVMLGLYHDLGTLDQLTWATAEQRLPWTWRFASVDPNHGDFKQMADEAWRVMAADQANHVLGARDADHLRARYLQRPGADYRFFRLQRRLSRQTVALVVLRMGPGGAEWLDFIGPRAALPLAVRAAKAVAARAGAATLVAWASPLASETLLATGAERTGTAAHFAVARASEISEAGLTSARWWWLGGDTDFL